VKLSGLPRLFRTLRHYRAVQLAAQVRHVLSDEGRPGVPRGDAPPLAFDRARVPFLPAPAHVRFDGEREIELIRRKHRFEGEIDWQFDGYGPLWAFHLHQFDWARSAEASPEVRARFVLDWIGRCERGHGWAPHPISLRILSWAKLLLTPGMLRLDTMQHEAMRASLAQQAETLSQRLEVRLQANHLFSNLVGVVFAGLVFEGPQAERWLALFPQLVGELDEQILADGSHVERCPMYHGLLLENVLDLLNVARASGRAPASLCSALEDAAGRMLGAHAVWTHPDGEIALFGDSAFDIAQPPARLREYAHALEVAAQPPANGQLANAGIYRFAAGPFTLLATTAAPAPSYQPGHAHCDALSFELSYGDERVVSDTGVSEYIPGAVRSASRATSSHATIEFDGEEQSEIWSAHRVGGRARCAVVSVEAGRLVANCSPWSRPDTLHERRFSVQDGRVEIEDLVRGSHRSLQITLPMGPDVAALELGEGAQAARIQLRSGALLVIELPAEFEWRVERRPFFPRFGERMERDALVGKAAALANGLMVFRAIDG